MTRSHFGAIVKRAGRPGYYLRITWKSRRVWRYAGPQRTIANSRLHALHVLLTKGERLEDALAEVFDEKSGTRLTFRQAIEPYLTYASPRKRASTLRTDRQRLALLAKAPWSAGLLSEIHPREIVAWADARVTAGTSGATLNRDLNLASALYRWAIRVGHVETNPLTRVERYDERGRARLTWLTATESEVLLAATPPWLRPIILTALRTGMRQGELLGLRWRAVDLVREEINVDASLAKGKRGRVIPFGAALRAVLLELRATRPLPALDASDFVFRDASGAPLTKKVLRTAYLSAVSKATGIPLEKRDRLTFHGLRHTAASLMVQAGVPFLEVMAIFGWKTMAMVQRYAHLAPGAQRRAIVRLDEAFDAASKEGTTGSATDASEVRERPGGWEACQRPTG